MLRLSASLHSWWESTRSGISPHLTSQSKRLGLHPTNWPNLSPGWATSPCTLQSPQQGKEWTGNSKFSIQKLNAIAHREGALERFHEKSGGRSLKSYCSKSGRWPHQKTQFWENEPCVKSVEVEALHLYERWVENFCECLNAKKPKYVPCRIIFVLELY